MPSRGYSIIPALFVALGAGTFGCPDVAPPAQEPGTSECPDNPDPECTTAAGCGQDEICAGCECVPTPDGCNPELANCVDDEDCSEGLQCVLCTCREGEATDTMSAPTTGIEETTGLEQTTGDPPETTGLDSSSGGTGDPPSGTPGDFDGDGQPELVVHTTYSFETFLARVLVFNISRAVSSVDDALHVFDGGFEGSGDSAVCNVDGEGPPEVLIGGDFEGQDALSIFHTDGTTTTVELDDPFYRLRCEDFDGDGTDDIVLGAYGFNPNNVEGAQLIRGSDIVLGTNGPAPQTAVGVPGFTTTKVLTGRTDGGTPHLITVEPGTPNPDGMPGAGAVTIYDLSGPMPVELGVIFGATADENFGNDVQVCDTNGDGTDEIVEITPDMVRAWSAVDGTSDAPDWSAPTPFSATFGGCEPQRGYVLLSDDSMTGVYQLDGSGLTEITTDDTLQVLELGDGEFAETVSGEFVEIDVDIDAGTMSWGGIVNLTDVDADTIAQQVLNAGF